MIDFPCQRCRTVLRAGDAQAGQLVKCPSCLSAVRVPERTRAALVQATVASDASATLKRDYSLFTGVRGSGRRYGFNCAFCSSRLEATESMAAQEGQCPTCGSQIVIPILDRYGRLIDPITQQIIKQDPHPVHAYAAAGDRAPAIVRHEDGSQLIKCPRCGAVSPVTCNNCKSCGLPFTMEGTLGADRAGTANGFCVASMVMGIISIPAGCTIVPPFLAILFGMIGLSQIRSRGQESAGRGMAFAGITCGIIGGGIGLLVRLR